jgi:hypothetical protein
MPAANASAAHFSDEVADCRIAHETPPIIFLTDRRFTAPVGLTSQVKLDHFLTNRA